MTKQNCTHSDSQPHGKGFPTNETCSRQAPTDVSNSNGNLAKNARMIRRMINSKKRVPSPTMDEESLINNTMSKIARDSRKKILASKRLRTSVQYKAKGKSIMDDTFQNSQVYSVTKHHTMLTSIIQTLAFQNDMSKYSLGASTSRDNTSVTEYIDFGDPIYTCTHCNAFMWYEERSGKKKNTLPLKFPNCCSNGKVEIPNLTEPPLLLRNLIFGMDSRSQNFIQNIRAYNMMFSFTSMTGTQDNSINRGGGPYIYRLQGANYHKIGSLLPEHGHDPKFAQLYIYDTEHEVQNRISVICGDASGALDPHIVDDLKTMMDETNPLAIQFRTARERFENATGESVRLKLNQARSTDGRTHNLPTAPEVAALIVGDIDINMQPRDVILQTRDGDLQFISELHPSYLPLQYPMIFPYAEDGYRLGIEHKDASSTSRKRVRLTMREFFAYRMHERWNEPTHLFHCRRLFQQFLVDAYTMIESERISYIRNNQVKLRVGKYNNLADAVHRGAIEPSSSGKRIMPSTFTGGPRYMKQNFRDAMAICKWYSYPDLFITFTCNPKWPEITRFLNNKGLRSEDRPDILCRMFKMKLDHLIQNLRERQLFGQVEAMIYTVEFQKRGLPHAHILLFLHNDNKIPTANEVDHIISAEIPSKDNNLKLHDLVCEYMMHGPCGNAHRKSPCMQEKGRCSKHFPKPYKEKTTVDEDGYPLYKRRNDGITVTKSGVDLDNSFVVPYNSTLLCAYQAHINVEWCNKNKSIKYLFKYINKGPDRITANITQNNAGESGEKSIDEIQEFITCRYISPCEAVWRTMEYEIHYRFPPVQRLSFHLPNEQGVIFDDYDSIDDVLNRPTAQESMFLAWMAYNKQHRSARNLTYLEFPSKFVWDGQKREWHPRQQGFSLGRLQHSSPGAGEHHYLGLLIPHAKGATCYEDIRTINGILYPNFKDACYSLGLLSDDREYVDGILEASYWASAHYLRNLFAILLMSSSMSSPEDVFNRTWKCLSDDILHRQRRILNMSDLRLTDLQLKNYALVEIENLLQRNGTTLRRFETMPFPDQTMSSEGRNHLIQEELNYDRQQMDAEHKTLFSKLTAEQKGVYEQILASVWSEMGGMFFLYGFGGTGKTFVWSTLSAAIRSYGHIVLNVASSGIASLLLPGGRTAHSRFSIPINIDESSTCHIHPGSEVAELISKAKLIIWDEAPMINRHCFEALDRSLRDIIRKPNGSHSHLPFGGKTIVLGGDFRQILPVVPKGTREDIVYSTINSSHLWNFCTVLRLSKNMRLQNSSSETNTSFEETAAFSSWILKLGDGNIGESDDGFSEIEIPEENLIYAINDPIVAIVNCVYPSITQKFCNDGYFDDRAILTPTHKVVESINESVLDLIPGDVVEYLSSDKVLSGQNKYGSDEELYSVDYLNSIRCSGLPNHRLLLKVGVPIMLLRNIDQRSGLCNGTRLITTKLGKHIIEAKIITGRNVGSKVYIPRMILSTSDQTSPVSFQRRQFPILLCFAMTINKSQGQSLSTVGVYLPKPVFTHGQLYVAVSRVKSKKGLKILCLDDEGKSCNHTTNVVYREVFRNL